MRAIIAEGFFLALFPSLAAAAVLFGIVTWIMRLQIDTKFKIRNLPFDVPAGLFAIISAISVFTSTARSFPLIYHYFAFVGVYGLTYILIGQNIRTREQIKSLVKALAASALLVVLWGYFQYIFGIDTADMKWVDPEKFPELRNRVFSTLENPNVLAGYLDIFICLALGVLAKVNGRTQKLAMIIAIAMLAACLAMTYSRGAFLTIVIVFIVYGIIQDWRILILFILMMIGLFYYDTTFVDRITSLFELTDSSQGLRIGIWVSTIAMIADHPFIGIGWGAYKFVYPNYDYYLKGADVTIYHAHNIYLNYAAEIGIVGALAFFWCFFGTMFMTLELGTNKKFQIIKEKFFDKVSKVTGIEIGDQMISIKDQIKNKYLIESGRLEKFIGLKEMLTEKMEDASEKFMNWLSPVSNNVEKIDDDDKDDEKSADKPKVSLKKKTDENAITDSDTKVAAIEISTDTTVVAASTTTIESDENVTSETVLEDVIIFPNASDELKISSQPVQLAATDTTLAAVSDSLEDSSKNNTVDNSDIDNKIESQSEDTVEAEGNVKSTSSETSSAKVINLFDDVKANPADDFDDSFDEEDDETEADEEKSIFNWNEVTEINNRQITEGVKFGIGLAFLSMALNGLTDDLLFNIPTSMLMWILVALGAAIESLPEEENSRRRNKR